MWSENWSDGQLVLENPSHHPTTVGFIVPRPAGQVWLREPRDEAISLFPGQIASLEIQAIPSTRGVFRGSFDFLLRNAQAERAHRVLTVPFDIETFGQDEFLPRPVDEAG